MHAPDACAARGKTPRPAPDSRAARATYPHRTLWGPRRAVLERGPRSTLCAVGIRAERTGRASSAADSALWARAPLCPPRAQGAPAALSTARSGRAPHTPARAMGTRAARSGRARRTLHHGLWAPGPRAEAALAAQTSKALQLHAPWRSQSCGAWPLCSLWSAAALAQCVPERIKYSGHQTSLENA